MIAILIGLGGHTSAWAAQVNQPVLILRADQTEYLLGTYLEYLEDPRGELNLDQVSSPAYDAQFKNGNAKILNFGLSNSTYWLRLRIRNDAPAEIKWRLELARPSMNTVIIYRPTGNGSGYFVKETGFIYPLATREIPHESFVFNLSVAPGAEQTIYLSVKDKSMELPLRIWQSEVMDQRNLTNTLLVGLSFGALIIMFVYNLFMTAILKEKSAIYYSCFQLSLLVMLGSVQGYAPRYLWPNQTQINIFIIPLSIELGLISTLLFAGIFFQIHQQPPGWRFIYRALLTMLILCTIPTPVIAVKSLDVVLPLALLTLIYVPLLALWSWLHGYKPARYYLISWTVFFIIGFGVILERMGFFTLQLAIPEQALQFGVVYVVAFQSLALADRFNLYKEETIKAQNALVAQQQEALRLNDALTQTLEHARDELENKVSERTQALHKLNQELAREIESREQAQKEAEYLARIDPLTGLYNRRHFSHLVELELKKAIRYQQPLSILIMDIDHFKNVNDTFGHQIGDTALSHVARILHSQSRAADVLARYGGEEFVALLPETTCLEAQISAERLRVAIQNANLKIDGHIVTLTVSIGVTGMTAAREIDHFEELLKQADEALYQAKNIGRNQVVVFKQS